MKRTNTLIALALVLTACGGGGGGEDNGPDDHIFAGVWRGTYALVTNTCPLVPAPKLATNQMTVNQDGDGNVAVDITGGAKNLEGRLREHGAKGFQVSTESESDGCRSGIVIDFGEERERESVAGIGFVSVCGQVTCRAVYAGKARREA